MRTILYQPHTVFPTVTAAEAVAQANAAEGDGWEYRVIADPSGSGRAIIRVFDEDGNFIENL